MEVGLFERVGETRTLRGLLLPFGELSRPNQSGTESIMFSADSVTLPRDPSVVTLNVGHDRFHPIGRALSLTKTTRGVEAEFAIAETDEGDAYLANPLRKLSAEVAGIVRRGAQAVQSRLTGAAAVPDGAFASAALFALAEGEEITEAPADEPTETKEETTETFTDEQGVEHERKVTRVTRVDGETTTITETIVITEPETPAEGEAEVPNATVPGTLFGAQTPAKTNEPVTQAMFAATVAAAIRQPEQAETLLAALNDVKVSGVGQVGTAAIAPDYIGEIWSGIPFARRIIPLLLHGDLTSLRTIGWRWVVEPEVAEWAGNKANVPSNTPTTENAEWSIQRFAGGWDLAREFIDFGETEVVNSFLTAAAGSYAKKSDAWALAQLLAAATASTVEDLPADVPAALVGIVDGSLGIIANDARPSYALVNPADYRPLLFTKKSDVLEYLNLGLGLEDGDLSGFSIVPHTGVPEGEVLTGAREAAAIHELPGSPIRVNALDMVKGGVDEALFGYVQFRDYYKAGIRRVSLTPAGGGA